MSTITFKYKNHRGEVQDRTVQPLSIEFMPNPGFGYQPGWFLRAYCKDKDAVRSFALVNIVLPGNRHFYHLASFKEDVA